MPDVASETRRRILNILEGVQSAVLTARNSTKMPTGYRKFELVLTTLADCRHSIERMQDRERDRDLIILMLRDASDTLRRWQAGITEIAVRSACLAINEIVADLEAKKPAA